MARIRSPVTSPFTGSLVTASTARVSAFTFLPIIDSLVLKYSMAPFLACLPAIKPSPAPNKAPIPADIATLPKSVSLWSAVSSGSNASSTLPSSSKYLSTCAWNISSCCIASSTAPKPPPKAEYEATPLRVGDSFKPAILVVKALLIAPCIASLLAVSIAAPPTPPVAAEPTANIARLSGSLAIEKTLSLTLSNWSEKLWSKIPGALFSIWVYTVAISRLESTDALRK